MHTTEVRDDRHGQRGDALTLRMGAVALPLGVLAPLVATAIHPHREDPMDTPVVFLEYALSDGWIAVHFAQWAGALLLFAGLLGVYYALRADSGPARALARLGAAATVQAAAAITALQAVDGVALKWAVDNWTAAPSDEQGAAYAAAQALRWTEYAMQSFSNVLLGLALVLYGLALAAGSGHPRWLGWVAVGSGAAWTVHGVTVSYVGLFDSTPRLLAMALLAVWAVPMASRMWRAGGHDPASPSAPRTASPAVR